MTIYTTSLRCKTKTGGVEKPAQLSITVEADSREEALQRMRSAAARVLSKPGTKDIGDHLLTRDEDGNITGSLIPHQSPFSFEVPGTLYDVHVGPSGGETYDQQVEAASHWTHGAPALETSPLGPHSLGPHTTMGGVLVRVERVDNDNPPQ